MMPLITTLNNPRVKKVIGNDKKLKIGLIKTFKTDKTILAINATQILLTKNRLGNNPEIAINNKVSTKTRVQ